MKKKSKLPDFTRRDFVKGGSFATLLSLLGAVELRAQDAPKKADDKPAGPQINIGVIGLGPRGREILAVLSRLKDAKVAAICDTYPAMLRRSAEAAPGASSHEDYKETLANKDIHSVVIATGTHQHKEITLAAMQAGKHVYCEAPLAGSMEDARAIAKAAQATPRVVFQSGLQFRSDPQRHFLLQFIRTGAMGKTIMARSQWHKKQSWRGTSPNAEREKAINWRLRSETSLGLIGEVGIHHLDAANWTINKLPTAATGFASTMLWNDGRDVPDTVQTVVDYPGGVRLMYDATLANSFDADYEVYYGTDSAIMIRGSRAWLFKEVDSPLLGWEVYARKDEFFKETGIALVANATKSTPPAGEGVESLTTTPLYYALESFVANCGEIGAAVEDFNATFNPKDLPALAKYLADIKRQPAAGWKEGFEATVMAIKTNEAIVQGQKLAFQKEWFELA